MRERRKIAVGVCALALSFGVPAFATLIDGHILGTSGWTAYTDNESTNFAGISVISVKPALRTVYIEIDKTFYDGIVPIEIKFSKTDSLTTIDRIVIVDEIVTNMSESTWSDFHLLLTPVHPQYPVNRFSFENLGPPEARYFDNNSVAFSPGTFALMDGYLGGPREIDFENGLIVPGDSFQLSRTGPDIAILTAPEATDFILREVPTPEPGSLFFLATGFVSLLKVRRGLPRRLGMVLVCAGALGFSGGRSVEASLMKLDTGWYATTGMGVTITSVQPSDDTIRITISKVFDETPTEGGILVPLDIKFTKTSSSAVNHIIITNEIVTNQTPLTWDVYHMVLITQYPDQSKFVTSPAPTAGNGFGAGAFPDAWSLDFSGGTVNQDTDLTIQNVNIDVSGFPTNRFFLLKEWPEHVPEPMSLLLLATGGISLVSRRRLA